MQIVEFFEFHIAVGFGRFKGLPNAKDKMYYCNKTMGNKHFSGSYIPLQQLLEL
jgi:hypothetical protein